MKIAFHSYQLGERGTEICLYKYAKYNREILGNESIIISTSSRPIPCKSRFDEFKTILYPDVWQGDGKNNALRNTLENICEKNGVDVFYAIKGGEDDGFMPSNTKRLAHCIFRMDEPHGDVYSGVCKYISDKYGGIHPYVHHILDKEAPHVEDNFREEFGIPKDALVLGRHGGREQFSLPFVHSSINTALQSRKDLYFVFLNTNKFINHERVIYLPWTMDEEYKAKFVNTCDGMIHARYDGEIFSLSTAEFSVRNKPVITWNPTNPPSHYDTGHIYVMDEDAIYYKDYNELVQILLNLDKKEINNMNWNQYCGDYTAEKVMNEFKEVYLND
mgnify:CR=1 FL=1|tara:strand:- start:1803 stop:2795 length:993 start_codon:yes stop_codon:yes gene_type:complete